LPNSSNIGSGRLADAKPFTILFIPLPQASILPD
jgi:hypothetical protein